MKTDWARCTRSTRSVTHGFPCLSFLCSPHSPSFTFFFHPVLFQVSHSHLSSFLLSAFHLILMQFLTNCVFSLSSLFLLLLLPLAQLKKMNLTKQPRLPGLITPGTSTPTPLRPLAAPTPDPTPIPYVSLSLLHLSFLSYLSLSVCLSLFLSVCTCMYVC